MPSGLSARKKSADCMEKQSFSLYKEMTDKQSMAESNLRKAIHR